MPHLNSTANDACRDPDDRAVCWNIGDDNGIGPDSSTVADGDAANDFRTSPDKQIVPKLRCLALFGADRDLVLNSNVSATAYATINHDAIRVDNHQPWSELSTAANYTAAKCGVYLVE